jgi:hypothetical protein
MWRQIPDQVRRLRHLSRRQSNSNNLDFEGELAGNRRKEFDLIERDVARGRFRKPLVLSRCRPFQDKDGGRDIRANHVPSSERMHGAKARELPSKWLRRGVKKAQKEMDFSMQKRAKYPRFMQFVGPWPIRPSSPRRRAVWTDIGYAFRGYQTGPNGKSRWQSSSRIVYFAFGGASSVAENGF